MKKYFIPNASFKQIINDKKIFSLLFLLIVVVFLLFLSRQREKDIEYSEF